MGYCNICDAHGALTEDHVPPKGLTKVRQADLLHLVELLRVERPPSSKKKRHMQSGVYFRSLCKRCNSTLLGAKYDPKLIEFCNSIVSFLKSGLAIPNQTVTTGHPGFIARAVLGHLLALGIERRERNSLMQEAIDFFLDESLPMPKGLEMYYWIYPHRLQVAIRDSLLLSNFFKSPPIHYWCLKFFPIGFFITWNNNKPHSINLSRLRDYMLNAGNHPANLPLILNPLPSHDWPEAPTDEGAVLFGDCSFGAIPKER